MSHRWRILILCGSVVACFDAKFPGPNARCFTCLTITESLVGAADRYHGELEKHGVLRTLPGRHFGAGSACKRANNKIYRQVQHISVVESCDDHGDSTDTHDSYHHVPCVGRLSRIRAGVYCFRYIGALSLRNGLRKARCVLFHLGGNAGQLLLWFLNC